MSKLEKKNLADLIDTKKLDALETAVNQIHQQSKVEKEKTVRATVDIPETFHKELKKLLIDESLELKTFFIQAIQEKYERLAGQPDDRLNG